MLVTLGVDSITIEEALDSYDSLSIDIHKLMTIAAYYGYTDLVELMFRKGAQLKPTPSQLKVPYPYLKDGKYSDSPSIKRLLWY